MIDTRFKELREDSEVKQIDLARYLNITQPTYSDYENGKINIPIEMFIKIADFYETSVDYLIGRTDFKKPYPKNKKHINL